MSYTQLILSMGSETIARKFVNSNQGVAAVKVGYALTRRLRKPVVVRTLGGQLRLFHATHTRSHYPVSNSQSCHHSAALPRHGRRQQLPMESGLSRLWCNRRLKGFALGMLS